MRVLLPWDPQSFKTNMRLLWARVTFSRLTTVYFTFSVLHCIVQLILQSRAFQINNQAAIFLRSVVVQGDALRSGWPVFDDKELRICDYLPLSLDADTCPLVWDGSPGSSNSISSAKQASGSSSSPYGVGPSSSPITSTSSTSALSENLATVISTTPFSIGSSTATASTQSLVSLQKTVTVTEHAQPTGSTISISSLPAVKAKADPGDTGAGAAGNPGEKLFGRQFPTIQAIQTENGTEVTLDGYAWHGTPAVLDQTCLLALNFPLNILEYTKREDITFIAFQLWVLGMSVIAILNESIPHIMASLLTHLVATGWAIFQINSTAEFKRQFIELTIKGACQPVNLLPNYWKARGIAEISSLTLNIVALLISAILTWKLVKLFGWQTFKRIGASLSINRYYKIALTLSITIQLSLFFMFVSVSLWLDQLFNSAIGRFASLATLYKISSIATLVLLIPWLMIGWFAVRRELRILMMVFLVLCIAYLAGWAFMFISKSFRFTFIQWRFFSLITSASVLLTLAAFVLGIICRFNFGKGLPRYLQAQMFIDDSDDSTYSDTGDDMEKIDFPSRNIPVFSTLFAPSVSIIPGFRSDRGTHTAEVDAQVQSPAPVHVRSSPNNQRLSREKSVHNDEGNLRRKASENSHGSPSKRWVIE